MSTHMRVPEDTGVDLHIHSTYSDGLLTPSELVAMAQRCNVTTLAITDHDSVEGIREGMEAAQQAGIDMIAGVELSVRYESFSDVHLLGYGFDYNDAAFGSFLERIREERLRRGERILDKINGVLIFQGREPLAMPNSSGSSGAFGRPHLARMLMEEGYVTSMEEAFTRYLVPCNVPKFRWEMNDALEEINRLGGVAVLAHPTEYSHNQQELRRLVTSLADLGIEGVEVYNSQADPGEVSLLMRLAEQRSLLVTAGSDFHTPGEGVELGRGSGGIRFPVGLVPPLKQRINDKKQGDSLR